MSTKPYTTVIGLEIHVELSTVSKMFSWAPNDPFHAEPNTNLTPICIGMPGTLPVPNREAIRRTILLGLALGSTIPRESKFDRKHYFYPDLPKGYQISQYDQPFCQGGQLTVAGETVNFTRVHLEEDAGKLLHGGNNNLTAVDLNRAGVALVEIVTDPDLRSAEQARLFLQELRLLVRTLGIADAEMEKGQLRCDANVSIDFEEDGQTVKSYISEVKNLNSFRMVERAIQYEAERLYKEWHDNPKAREQKHKITVGWDDAKGVTKLQRTKEEAADYRYFPEPDIPAFRIYDGDNNDPRPEGIDAFDLAELRHELPELPWVKRERYEKLGLKPVDADVLACDPDRAAVFERVVAEAPETPVLVKTAAFLLNENVPVTINPTSLIAIAGMALNSQIDSSVPRQLFEILTTDPNADPEVLVKERNWLQNSDEGAVAGIVDEVIAANPEIVAQYKEGKIQVIGFLIGRVRQKAGGTANPQLCQRLLSERLK